ncbi:uncharacterized protein BYT42DRAFT_345965 [Radiomyces spectabilis]|uniref:uncharacterized protein n=1 Tax=Radiomyces spectabilis TaxID=64574 RepID=UPI00221EFBAE|nr:uncharacterized protein BYT42DRAFT_345965 [Radiomyces spectabilis]KAI8377480.1 hypothetical protein BYT42DRAFT_345965 [Radiomyces spectabilis]
MAEANRYSQLQRQYFDDLDDIDRSSDEVSHYEDDDSYYDYDAEREWEESKEQISSLFSLVVFPFAGKWLGKKVSFWLYSRYLGTNPYLTKISFFSFQWLHGLKQFSK